MRLPRPRLSLRTLLIAVAVAGLALGGWTMWQRREYCLERARAYELEEDAHIRTARLQEGSTSWSRQCAVNDRRALDLLDDGSRRRDGPKLMRAIADHEESIRGMESLAAEGRAKAGCAARMARRYRHVARHPWLPMPRESE
jgi:hypothetical protein